MNTDDTFLKINRRRLLGLAAGAGLVSLLPRQVLSGSPDWVIAGQTASREQVRYPEKTGMILITDRPPQLETPLHFFRQDLTPNSAHFVRWHLSGYRLK
ncbi:hypothetical protein [Pseudomonas sp. RU47]|uniref:hypothetical protein n=1 Tax=Pseudomonas sp. RU47 TaxID=2005388 RepID=UPI001EE8D831|nr:hypothetical protein [Pseudomonas sp. RU47]